METNELVALIKEVTGTQVTVTKFVEREDDRRAAFENAMNGLSDQKDSIRDAMRALKEVDPGGRNLKDEKGQKKYEKAFSKDGQEYAIDTFKTTREGRGLSAGDMKKAGAALEPVFKAAREMLSAKGRDGKPLFDTKEEFEAALMNEFFTPLVREGIIPDNFVLNKFSEVQRMLDRTFESYKKTNTETRSEIELANAKDKADLSGADGGLSKLAARGKALSKLPNKALDRIGINEKARRRIGIVVAAGSTAQSMYSMGTTLDSWKTAPGGNMPTIEKNFAEQLDPSLAGYNDADPDEARTKMAQAERLAKIHKYVTRLGLSPGDEQRIVDVLNVQDDTAFSVTKESVSGFSDVLNEVITGLALPGDKLRKLNEALDQADHEAKNVDAALKAAQAIDAALVEVLNDKLGDGVGALVARMYAAQIDVSTVSEAVAQSQPDDQALLGEFASAFQGVFETGLDPQLAGMGTEIAKSFLSKAEGAKLRKSLKADPATAFDPLVEAARSAIGERLKSVGPGDKAAALQGVLTVAFASLARAIDAAIVGEIKASVSESAAEAIDGLFLGRFQAAAAAKAVKTTPAVDADQALRLVSQSIEGAFIHAAPDPSDKAYLTTGRAAAKAFRDAAKSDVFSAELGKDVKSAFRMLLDAPVKAIASSLNSHKQVLQTALGSPEAQRALASKAVFPDGGEEAVEELRASEEELKEYERQLVLIDEGGAAAADLQSIERLIQKIERDRAIAELVLSAGGVLTSLGVSSTSIAGSLTVQITDTLVGEIAGPLKAAKLILKFSVAMKEANERRILLLKFKKSLKLAKNAVSPLQSTVKGFFDNKVEQITFRTIEDALTLVQIAAAIVGSVPEPITMAVGKTLGKVAEAMEGLAKVTEMTFNEAMLSHGWSVTLTAIQNPKDRATGLQALRLNPTLGMHAIAWAGMERRPPDPIARNLLAELGLNEQTLQVSGSEVKVRKYLETLLAEDRTMLDPDEVAPNWVPKPIELTVESWSVTVNRAWSLAEPKLKRSNERHVLAQFKLVGSRNLLDAEKRAIKGEIGDDEMQAMLDEVAELSARLKQYTPVATDGSVHGEMLNVSATFLKLASEREAEVRRLIRANHEVQMQDKTRVNAKLEKQVEAMTMALSDQHPDHAVLERMFDDASTLLREVQFAGLDGDDDVRKLYDEAMLTAHKLNEALTHLEESEEDEVEITNETTN